MSTPSNRHPVDELADVRAEIKQLELREGELRQSLIEGDQDAGLIGDQYTATIDQRPGSERLDRKLLEQHLGAEGIKPFLKKNKDSTVVTLHHRLNQQEG